jgi:hypothetical protein
MLITISTFEDIHPINKTERARVWSMFLNGGGNHSHMGLTLAYILRRCEQERVPYILTAYPGVGYELRPMLEGK